MLADFILPFLSKWTSINFPIYKRFSTDLPNLEELSFLTVFAFPKASKIGFESNTLSSIPLPSSCLSSYIIKYK